MDENAGVGVASERAHPVSGAAEPRFCRWCGTKSEPTAEFCGECGQPLSAAQDTSEQPTAQWAAEAGQQGWQQPPPMMGPDAGPAMQMGPPAPPAYMPYPYAGEQPGGGSHTGLLIGLIAAVIAALGAVAAVVILASSGGGKGPTISAATNAAVKTVTTPATTSGNRHPRVHHRSGGTTGPSLAHHQGSAIDADTERHRYPDASARGADRLRRRRGGCERDRGEPLDADRPR